MYCQALTTVVPPRAYPQTDLQTIFLRSEARKHLRTRSSALMEKLLGGNNGIQTRHLALEPLEKIFDLDAEALNRAFEIHAPRLGARALQEALTLARWEPGALDALFVCTCTGYLCPGVSSHLAEQAGLRPDTVLQDLVGMGCGAAIPTLRAAVAHATAFPGSRVAVVAVEVCSAAFYLDDDPGVLISASLFGDGAACLLLGPETQSDRPSWRLNHFDTLHRPDLRETLRFENREGKLRNRLHRSVPEVAAEAVSTLLQNFGTRHPPSPPPKILAHPGGRDVIRALQNTLPDQPELAESAWVIHHGGNLSSPSILFALAAHWSQRSDAPPTLLPPSWAGNCPSVNSSPPADLWLTSFGAGFTAHSVALSISPLDPQPKRR